MGQAKRRRERLGKPAGQAIDIRSGRMLETRHAGRLSEFIHQSNVLTEAGVLERPVPCAGCTACCYHPRVDLNPAEEPPERLAHLEIVEDDNGMRLAKRPDGACVHLGPQGCTVYAYRPIACRAYDCRLFALIGVSDHYDGDQLGPSWQFEVQGYTERLYEAALRVAAARYIAGRSSWTAPGALIAAFCGLDAAIPTAREMLEAVDKLTPAQKQQLGQSVQAHLERLQQQAKGG